MKITRKAGKIDAMKTAVKALQGEEGSVGWFESAKTEDGEPVAGIAVVQEFGSPKRGIPSRSFMRTTVAEQSNAWAKLAEGAARAVMQGKAAPGTMTEMLALKAEGDVRRKITKILTPPLSLLTLMARKDRKDAVKRARGQMKFGPQQRYKMTGKRLGELARSADKGPPDVTGVSTKPLVDTGLMLATLTSVVTKK